MLSLLTLFSALGAGLCTGSCTREDLLAPVAVQSPAALLVTSDSLCARVTVTDSGTSTISSTWPSTSSCTTKLVLIKGSTPKWAGSTRKLSLFIKLTNKSGRTLQLPVRLYLPATGVTVLTPSGTPSSTVVALNPDSSEAGGGRVWFTGGTGTLANNSPTVLDTLLFTLASPASQVRFSFVATANSAGGGSSWPIFTSTTPDLDTTRTVVLPGGDYVYYRTDVYLRFRNGVTDSQKAAAMTNAGATILGATKAGNYFVRFPDPGSTPVAFEAMLTAISQISVVSSVVPIRRSAPSLINYTRYPSDGAGQSRSDYLNPSSLTWAARAVRLPAAWGCETGQYGGVQVPVALLEYRHDNLHPEFQGSAAPTRLRQVGAGGATHWPTASCRQDSIMLLGRLEFSPVSETTVRESRE
jgi:hypothetical protein